MPRKSVSVFIDPSPESSTLLFQVSGGPDRDSQVLPAELVQATVEFLWRINSAPVEIIVAGATAYGVPVADRLQKVLPMARVKLV